VKKAAGVRAHLFRDARAAAFGLAVFMFSWICWREPEWNDYQFMFAAGALLAGSILILVRSVWSNFVAAVLGGYLPMELAYEFWMMPRRAEVPLFSPRHLECFARGFVEAGGPFILSLALSVFIIACSAQTLKRLSR
jgi:hypothetical protein